MVNTKNEEILNNEVLMKEWVKLPKQYKEQSYLVKFIDSGAVDVRVNVTSYENKEKLTREEIIEEALKHLAEYGINVFSSDDVCEIETFALQEFYTSEESKNAIRTSSYLDDLVPL